MNKWFAGVTTIEELRKRYRELFKKPMHRQTAFSGYAFQELKYSATEKICERCLSLPMHSYLSTTDIQNVIDTVIPHSV